MSDDARLEALELAVARLTKEMVAMRSELRRTAPAATSAMPGVPISALPTSPAPAVSAGSTESVTSREPRGVEGRGVADTGGPPQTPISFAANEAPSSSNPLPDQSNALGAESPRTPRSEPFVSDELRRIAAGLGPIRAAPPRPATSHSASAPSWSMRRGDLERIVGRYGTLALAALTILMGVGAFLGWAVRNGVIGPEMRVALGAVAAAVVAGFGWKLRHGSTPRFGDILLGLALAIVHVVCWGAGPLLNLVPEVVALGVAAVASAALAALSLREEDQSLFNVGFGGALLAPFVTSSGDGNPILLLLYGAFVLAAGMHAMRDREWGKTPLVQMLGIAVYTTVATEQLRRDELWTHATAPALFALAVAWLSLILVRGATRARVAQVALVAALSSLVALHDGPSTDWPRIALALVATITGFVSSSPTQRSWRSMLLGALALPIAAVAIAISTLPSPSTTSGGELALLWCAASATAAWFNRDGERATHAFTATLLGGLALVLPVASSDVQTVLRLAAYCGVLSLAIRRVRLAGLALAAGLWLPFGAAVAFSSLSERVSYTYRPFQTEPSLAAAAISLAWLLFSWNASRYAINDRRAERLGIAPFVRILGAVVTFFWIHQELAGAISNDVSTFLLVGYYALSGVVAIGVGRWRAIPVLRQVGLGLSVLAAIKAIAESSGLSIGWRVGGYMMAGLFLLGVAYWYRASGRTDDVTSAIPSDHAIAT
ncbi:MAG: DUF2339 domain-containing protein [Gemmatimonadaceae bacterium]